MPSTGNAGLEITNDADQYPDFLYKSFDDDRLRGRCIYFFPPESRLVKMIFTSPHRTPSGRVPKPGIKVLW